MPKAVKQGASKTKSPAASLPDLSHQPDKIHLSHVSTRFRSSC
jgi:hypothetical protein